MKRNGCFYSVSHTFCKVQLTSAHPYFTFCAYGDKLQHFSFFGSSEYALVSPGPRPLLAPPSLHAPSSNDPHLHASPQQWSSPGRRQLINAQHNRSLARSNFPFGALWKSLISLRSWKPPLRRRCRPVKSHFKHLADFKKPLFFNDKNVDICVGLNAESPIVQSWYCTCSNKRVQPLWTCLTPALSDLLTSPIWA